MQYFKVTRSLQECVLFLPWVLDKARYETLPTDTSLFHREMSLPIKTISEPNWNLYIMDDLIVSFSMKAKPLLYQYESFH